MLFPALLAQVDSTELVLWHRASDSAPKGCGLLFSFQSLFYLISPCFFLYLLGSLSLSRFEVTVTSVSTSSPTPSVSLRGRLSKTHRFSRHCVGACLMPTLSALAQRPNLAHLWLSVTGLLTGGAAASSGGPAAAGGGGGGGAAGGAAPA